MRPIYVVLMGCGLTAVAGCASSSLVTSEAPPPAAAQTAAVVSDPQPPRVAQPRRRAAPATVTARPETEVTSSVPRQDEAKPVVFNSPEWREREKRREEELSRKINSICRGC